MGIKKIVLATTLVGALVTPNIVASAETGGTGLTKTISKSQATQKAVSKSKATISKIYSSGSKKAYMVQSTAYRLNSAVVPKRVEGKLSTGDNFSPRYQHLNGTFKSGLFMSGNKKVTRVYGNSMRFLNGRLVTNNKYYTGALTVASIQQVSSKGGYTRLLDAISLTNRHANVNAKTYIFKSGYLVDAIYGDKY